MKKIKRLSVISATIGLTGLLLSGCAPDHGMAAVYGPEIEASTEEEVEYSEDVSSSETEVESEQSTEDVEEETDIASSTPYFFQETDCEYTYDVTHLIDDAGEEVNDEVPVKVEKLASYDGGNVYRLMIQHEDFEDDHFYDANARKNIGTFYVTTDKIYVLMYRDDAPSEEEFLSDGIVVCSEEDSSELLEAENEQLEIKHDGDVCTCSMWSTVGESGFYYTYEWTKGKGLTLFRSGYGAEGEPIDISLKKDGCEKIKFTSEENEFTDILRAEGNSSLLSIVTDMDKDGKKEAFVIDGDECDIDSAIVTDDEDSAYRVVDHLWFVGEDGKSEELTDLTDDGLTLSMTQKTFDAEDNSFVILNGYNGVDGVGMVYTVKDDKLISAAPDTLIKGRKYYDGKDLIWTMEYYGNFVDEVGVTGHVQMPYHLFCEKGVFKMYGSKEVTKEVVEKFEGIGLVFLYDAKKTQFILRDNNELDINYMIGDENDYTVRSKVYKLDEETNSWELESSLNGYFLVDLKNSKDADFLSEYQN